MENLVYEVEIEASIEKVWDILWNSETYNAWTKFFAPDSTMRTDWKIGGKTYFLDGEGNGMVSTIEQMQKPEILIFKHLGMIKEGKEDLESEEVKGWSGSLEKYFLTQKDNITALKVEVATLPEYMGMLKSGFVQGFDVVKKMAEAK
ncbi:SRPBCC family protein [Acinetobacter sp. WU_MDCI_Abxb74]|uniref:SRPBCC family protein n=1 Tax=Acinetobacter sp. WU_MDCI_Abxb74 TaxID=2850072 RepID=UPI0021CD3F0F|nr:SRPBCC domain-containing protein [Acinetobacter sp. WU_MDCI_Abxb74]MCU4424345.1 SRPBCC domain-containing protein [Acinetobacter sp. WU_MDCI_Abxb74]